MTQRDYRSGAVAKSVAFRPVTPLKPKTVIADGARADQAIEAEAPAAPLPASKSKRSLGRGWILPVLAVLVLGVSWVTKSSLRSVVQPKPQVETAGVASPGTALPNAQRPDKTTASMVDDDAETLPPSVVALSPVPQASALDSAPADTSAQAVAPSSPSADLSAEEPVPTLTNSKPGSVQPAEAPTMPETSKSTAAPVPAASLSVPAAPIAPAASVAPAPAISAADRSVEPGRQAEAVIDIPAAVVAPARKPAPPVSNEIVCFAGCSDSKNKVVFIAPPIPARSRSQDVAPVALVALNGPRLSGPAQSAVVACVAGCYESSTAMQVVSAPPRRRGQGLVLQALVTAEVAYLEPMITQVRDIAAAPQGRRRR